MIARSDSSKNLRNLIFILFLTVFFSSCDNAVEDTGIEWENIDCDNLKTGIVNTDSEIVKVEINKLVTDLVPVITDSDPLGHKDNLALLIEQLNIQCDNITAEMLCYACIFTNPPQTEILVTTDSLGTDIHRIIDIVTPDDDQLSMRTIH